MRPQLIPLSPALLHAGQPAPGRHPCPWKGGVPSFSPYHPPPPLQRHTQVGRPQDATQLLESALTAAVVAEAAAEEEGASGTPGLSGAGLAAAQKAGVAVALVRALCAGGCVGV